MPITRESLYAFMPIWVSRVRGAKSACLLLLCAVICTIGIVSGAGTVAAQTAGPCQQIELLPREEFASIDELGKQCMEALPDLPLAAQNRHVDFYVYMLPSYVPPEELPELVKKLKPEPKRKMKALALSRQAVRGVMDMEEADALLARARERGDDVSLSHLYYAKGVQIARDSGSPDEMERNFQASLQYALASEMTAAIPSIYNALAVRAKRDGEIGEAVSLYEQALAAHERLGRYDRTGVALTNIGNIFTNIGGAKEAIRFHSRAIEVYEEHSPDDVYRLAGAYGNLGMAYHNDNQFEKSAAAYAKAKEYNAKDPTDFLTGHLNLGHAEALYGLGEHDAAIAMAEHAIPQIMATRDEVEAASGLLWIARHYLSVDRIDEAQQTLAEARTIIEPNEGGVSEFEGRPGDVNYKVDYARLTGELLTELGRSEEAVPYLLSALSLSDARFEDEKMEAVANTELLFEIRDRDRRLERLEAEAALADSELRQSRLVIGLALAVALLIGTVAYGSFRSYRMQKALVKTRDVFLQEIHHRTGNNFQMMASLLRSEDRSRAKRSKDEGGTNNTANRIRAMGLIHEYLYNADGESITEVHPDKFLVDLLDLLHEGLGRKSIALTHEITSRPVDVAVATPLALLVCELVTNAYKHAFPDCRGTMKVTLLPAAKGLQLVVADDGRGFDHKEALNKVGSQGMHLIEDLTDQIGGKLDLISGANGTIWTVDGIEPATRLAGRNAPRKAA